MKNQKELGGKSIRLSVFPELFAFLRPYYTQVSLFLLALIITAGVTLAIGQGLKLVIDEGFNDPSFEGLNNAVMFLMTASISSLVIGLFRFSISSCSSLSTDF